MLEKQDLQSILFDTLVIIVFIFQKSCILFEVLVYILVCVAVLSTFISLSDNSSLYTPHENKYINIFNHIVHATCFGSLLYYKQYHLFGVVLACFIVFGIGIYNTKKSSKN